jgi:hypothetical protein
MQLFIPLCQQHDGDHPTAFTLVDDAPIGFFVACIPQFYQVKAVPYDEGQEAAGLNTRFSWG